MGAGRQRLPQAGQEVGGSGPSVLRETGQGGQLPGRNVPGLRQSVGAGMGKERIFESALVIPGKRPKSNTRRRAAARNPQESTVPNQAEKKTAEQNGKGQHERSRSQRVRTVQGLQKPQHPREDQVRGLRRMAQDVRQAGQGTKGPAARADLGAGPDLLTKPLAQARDPSFRDANRGRSGRFAHPEPPNTGRIGKPLGMPSWGPCEPLGWETGAGFSPSRINPPSPDSGTGTDNQTP